LDEQEKQELLELTREILDIKAEKKQYNADMNESIKQKEARIKELVKE
jgi:hypothetical protein